MQRAAERGMRRVLRAMSVVATIALAAGAGPVSAAAQRLGPEPVRKRSAIVADSNDAMALYEWGVERLERDPGAAADAFYWAARVNPAFAEPLYGRRVAMLLREPTLLNKLFAPSGRIPKEMPQLDSLLLRALTINPFLFRRFDRGLLVAWMKEEVERSVQSAGQPPLTPTDVDHFIAPYLRKAAPHWRAWMAYCNGDFATALYLYAELEKTAKDKAEFRVQRGRIFALQNEADSAIAQLTLALQEFQAKDAAELVKLYDSKAMLEHSIGALLEGKKDIAGARMAYGRALQEDLAFWPSHVRLGLIALGEKETEAALSELELATQIAKGEPYVHYTYGYALAAVGQFDAALAQLQQATTQEPLYAAPHALAGHIWEQRQDGAKAVAAYEAFLARASRNDAQRAAIAERLAEVKAFLKPPSP